MPDYVIQRSKRRSISLTVRPDGMVIVKAPLNVPVRTIDGFVESKKNWISFVLERNADRIVLKESVPYSLAELSEKTKSRIDDFMLNYPGKMPNAIKVRPRKSVWGTCNSKGTISINSFAGALPDELFEYIMIHELSHLEVLNHNKYFWNLVSYYLPDWKERRTKLRRYSIDI
ncbi:MAG: YgjP-like metallopeptidase domain-containing protein [Saccharofermentanales bacterium]